MNDVANLLHFADSIYRDFKTRLTCENFPLVFDYFDQNSGQYREERRGHALGHFAILYTPMTQTRPELMLIGDNPSWFDRKDMSRALAIVEEMERGVPQRSSYLEHDHVFANQLTTIFVDQLRRADLLQQCVGMNRFWVQTGADGVADFQKRPRGEEYRRLKRICERGTQEIVAALDPRVVILLGGNAQKAIPSVFRLEHQSIAFEHARHPGRGGVPQCSAEIKLIVEKHRL